MRALIEVLRRVVSLFHRRELEDRLSEEIQFHLEQQIPGWDPPFDADAARAMAKAARESLERGNEREALSRALRGLSFAPHDPPPVCR